ncbi:ParA family protein [Georgenia sp. EYE_87]|uniref:ParA family protein n=1 Tax=Georgenia sp. EYE_87 TaxID=2853448 RepID=UPI0020048F94|nr:ParA family protein [Georgenia sp. EYE_87]MCK6210567.1 ParA family protein [Georgenia sp. EYE_87]
MPSIEGSPFAGAHRVSLFEEQDPDPVSASGSGLDVITPELPGVQWPAHQLVLPEASRAGLIPPGSGMKPVASWGWRGAVVRATGGIVRVRPGAAELAHLAAERTIRQATWSRAVNVLVANKSGGVGKTVTSVVLAGVLAAARGGSVAAFEVSDASGALSKRAEGAPVRGLGELIERLHAIESAGELGGYTMPQTSHADLIGSVRDRPVLTAEDVLAVRTVLDRYYRVTVADSGNNPHSDAFCAAVSTADVLLLPVQVSAVPFLDMVDVLTAVRAMGEHGRHLSAKPLIVVNDDGRPKPADASHRVRRELERLAREGATVLEVPFDPHLAEGGEITLASLSDRSLRAWTRVGSAVIAQLAYEAQ